MTISGPRLRSLLRRAEKVVGAGKYAAAESLYQEIVDEDPQAVEGWLGIAAVALDPAVKQSAADKAAELGADETAVARALAGPEGIPVAESLSPPTPDAPAPTRPASPPQPPQPKPAPPQSRTPDTAVKPAPATTTPAPAVRDDHVHDELFAPIKPEQAEYDLFCYRHPDRATSLRCYKCSRPICMECTNKTPVGYLCPDCQREAEDNFFNARPLDNLLVVVAALPLSLLAGLLITLIGGGFFFILLVLIGGGAVGSLIGRLSRRIIGNRRGRYIPYIVAVCLIIGVGIFFIPALLTLSLGALLIPGIFLFVAVPAAFYWAR